MVLKLIVISSLKLESWLVLKPKIVDEPSLRFLHHFPKNMEK